MNSNAGSPEVRMQKARREIYVFGDSVMKGVVLDQVHDRYKLLPRTARERIEDEFQIKLNNRSHFGATITRGQALVKKIIERDQNCKTVVLEFGGNDSDFDWEAVAKDPLGVHEPHTTLEVFTKKYRELVEYLKEKKISPVLMNLPPILPERYLDYICRNGLSKENILSYIGDINMIYHFQELYSKAIEKIAHSTGAFLIDVRQAYLKRTDLPDLICIDGVHPNASGHELLYDVIRDFISQHLDQRDLLTGLV